MSEPAQHVELHYSMLRRAFHFWPYLCIGISLIGFVYIAFLVFQ